MVTFFHVVANYLIKNCHYSENQCIVFIGVFMIIYLLKIFFFCAVLRKKANPTVSDQTPVAALATCQDEL